MSYAPAATRTVPATTRSEPRHRQGAATRALEVVVDCLCLALGAAAVMLAVAVNQGAIAVQRHPAQGLSPDVVVVSGTPPSSAGLTQGYATTSLTSSDLSALGNPGYVPDAVAVAPTVAVRSALTAVARSATTDVIGTTDAYATVTGYSVAEGRFLTAADVADAAPVAVIGNTIVNELFAGGNPVGQDIDIGGQSVEVVGALAAKGYSGTYDQDDLVLLPITTEWARLVPSQSMPIDQILVRSPGPGLAEATARQVTSAMLQLHGITDPALADFTVERHSQIVAGRLAIGEAVRRLLEIVGALLLVGGVVQLAVARGPGWRARGRKAGRGVVLATLAEVLALGLVSAGAALVVALVGAPLLRHLVTGMPPANLTFYGVIAGAALAVVAAAVAVLAPAVGEGRRSASPGSGTVMRPMLLKSLPPGGADPTRPPH